MAVKYQRVLVYVTILFLLVLCKIWYSKNNHSSKNCENDCKKKLLIEFQNENSHFHLKVPYVKKLGIYDFSDMSVQPSILHDHTDILFLVITRWTAIENRNVMRNTFGKIIKDKENFEDNIHYNYKLLFTFSLPENPTLEGKNFIQIYALKYVWYLFVSNSRFTNN